MISPASGEVTYVNAGHNPPLIYHAPDSTQPCHITALSVSGMPLGIDEDARYIQYQEHINPGDFIVLYTDGVTDAMNEVGELFGMRRLQQVLIQHQERSATQIAAALEREIRDFSGSSLPFDDITFLIARRM